MGRFCVWSKSALEALDTIYGEDGKRIPAPPMVNADLARISNSDEIQSVVNPAKRANRRWLRKKNPIKNTKALAKINPYAAAARASETRAMEARATKKEEIIAKRRAANKAKKQYKAQGKAFYEKVSKQGDVCEDGFGL